MMSFFSLIRYLKIMRRLSAVDGDVGARKALLEDDMKRTDKIMMLEKVHPDKIERMKLKMNIIGSFFYNGLSSAGVPLFNNEEIEVEKEDEDEDEDEEGEEVEDDVIEASTKDEL